MVCKLCGSIPLAPSVHTPLNKPDLLCNLTWVTEFDSKHHSDQCHILLSPAGKEEWLGHWTGPACQLLFVQRLSATGLYFMGAGDSVHRENKHPASVQEGD